VPDLLTTNPQRCAVGVANYDCGVRLALWILLVIALPGLIYGSLVRSSAPRNPECGQGGNGLLSLLESRPCPPTDYGVLVAIGLIVVVAVIVVGVARARPH
jgi:hypothetical protein